MVKNPYLFHIEQNLPRLLGMFDRDQTSPGFGMGNRYHWAWGLIDFGNGTFQGAANGLALLWKSGLWPYSTSACVFLNRIDSIFQGTGRLVRQDGSLEEAFPYEGSYCVTALAAFDLLHAMESLQQDIDVATKARWTDIVRPMIRFLVAADETHGLISNHLATAVAALSRWHNLTGDEQALDKARVLLERVLQNQSPEGWFVEYQGADPGYQSLCTYYLADVYRTRPGWNLLEPLRRSVQFLWHFAHPDGSFGGVYGSRCTRFYNPAGMEALAGEIPEALALADYMGASIAENRVVTLSSIDEPNLIPWFNAYCWAAVMHQQRAAKGQGMLKLPCNRGEARQTRFALAGLLIDQGPDHYTVINTHKGGVTLHFKGGRRVMEDAGVVARNSRGVLGSSQGYSPDNRIRLGNNFLVVESFFQPMPRRLPNPFEFLALRFLCVTAFRFRSLRELVKRMLVRFLITNKQMWPGKNIRTIAFGPNLTVDDETELPQGYKKINNYGSFVAIHMASQGYWQAQDEEDAG